MSFHKGIPAREVRAGTTGFETMFVLYAPGDIIQYEAAVNGYKADCLGVLLACPKFVTAGTIGVATWQDMFFPACIVVEYTGLVHGRDESPPFARAAHALRLVDLREITDLHARSGWESPVPGSLPDWARGIKVPSHAACMGLLLPRARAINQHQRELWGFTFP